MADQIHGRDMEPSVFPSAHLSVSNIWTPEALTVTSTLNLSVSFAEILAPLLKCLR